MILRYSHMRWLIDRKQICSMIKSSASFLPALCPPAICHINQNSWPTAWVRRPTKHEDGLRWCKTVLNYLNPFLDVQVLRWFKTVLYHLKPSLCFVGRHSTMFGATTPCASLSRSSRVFNVVSRTPSKPRLVTVSPHQDPPYHPEVISLTRS